MAGAPARDGLEGGLDDFTRRGRSSEDMAAGSSTELCAVCDERLESPELPKHPEVNERADAAPAFVLVCHECGVKAHEDCLAGRVCPTEDCPAATRHAGGRRMTLDPVFGFEAFLRELADLRPERRIVRVRRLERVLQFLGYTIDDVVDDPEAARKVRIFYRIQGESIRLGEEYARLRRRESRDEGDSRPPRRG